MRYLLSVLIAFSPIVELWGQSASQGLLISQKISGAANNIAFVNQTSVKDSTGSNISTLTTPTISHTAGNLLVVTWRGGVSGGVSCTNTAGDTFTQINTASEASVGELHLLYAKNIIGNAADAVTCTWSNNTNFDSVLVSQYSGLNTTAPLDTSSTATSSTPGTTLTSGTFTTTSANEVIVAAASYDNIGITLTAGSGYTVRVQDAANMSGQEDKIVSATQSSVTASATISGSQKWIMLVGTFKQ